MKKDLLAYKLTMKKIINEGIKRGVRLRLEMILEEEYKKFQFWEGMVKEKQNFTRRKQIEREFNKRIQALKITIHMLTPFFERTTDVPMFVVKKK